MKMQKIMIIEDDLLIASSLKKHLEKWNYDVYTVTQFENIMLDFTRYQPHLVLLDISLPFFDGYHWCSRLEEISDVPIISISSANENMNVVMAMNMGGDDFISKPFDLVVLTAKIQALLRRTYSFSKDFHILTYQDIMLNLVDATLSYQNQSIELTKNQLKILELLFEKPQTIITREDIMNHLWQSHQLVDE